MKMLLKFLWHKLKIERDNLLIVLWLSSGICVLVAGLMWLSLDINLHGQFNALALSIALAGVLILVSPFLLLKLQDIYEDLCGWKENLKIDYEDFKKEQSDAGAVS